ncbi:MAG TPA: AraC family transcriptional regulator [Ktedonobacteraceae bacterium]|jgi:AraC family transcriptional regulator|nr:AraC family transcriptional regulator [Ktedonobacteraceae bacterium]
MKRDVPHSTSTYAFETFAPTNPIYSSLQAGWDGVVVRIYNEPEDVESIIFPAVPDVSLVMITQGVLTLESRDVGSSWETFRVCKGDWFLTPPGGSPYELRYRSLSSEPVQTLHVHVNTDLICRAAEQLTEGDPTRVVLMERSGFQDSLLTQIGLALQKELESPMLAGKLYAETAAQMLAVHLLRYYQTSAISLKDSSQGITRQQMKRVVEYIVSSLDQDLSLETLSQQIGFSPYHFARLFRMTTGESPHQFVLRKRIETAQRLLKETRLDLAEIAFSVGFPNQSHFTRVFKNRLGLTPHRYRREHQ